MKACVLNMVWRHLEIHYIHHHIIRFILKYFRHTKLHLTQGTTLQKYSFQNIKPQCNTHRRQADALFRLTHTLALDEREESQNFLHCIQMPLNIYKASFQSETNANSNHQVLNCNVTAFI